MNNNTFELILIHPILIDRQHHLIIRLHNNQTLESSDLHLDWIYLQPQSFTLKQISNNQTELYFH